MSELQMQPGQMCGPYKIVREIGRGGMAVVYLATSPAGEKRAIKMLQFSAHLEPDQLRRFENEIQLLATIDHPNVVKFYRSGELKTASHGSVLWVALAFLDGPTLREVIRTKGGRLSVEQVLGWCIEIADGVLAAHDLRVIHRDLKPNNVAVVDGKAIVFDFGIAKFRHWGIKTTNVNLRLGTVSYMAREQLYGEEVDERADVYALGMIMYELFTGKHAILDEGELLGPHEMMAQCMFKEPAPLCQLVADLPDKVGAIADKAVLKKSEQRFANMREMKAALQVALLQLSQSARKRRESRPSGERAVAAERPQFAKAGGARTAQPADTRSAARRLAQRLFMAAMGAASGAVFGFMILAAKAAVVGSTSSETSAAAAEASAVATAQPATSVATPATVTAAPKEPSSANAISPSASTATVTPSATVAAITTSRPAPKPFEPRPLSTVKSKTPKIKAKDDFGAADF